MFSISAKAGTANTNVHITVSLDIFLWLISWVFEIAERFFWIQNFITVLSAFRESTKQVLTSPRNSTDGMSIYENCTCSVEQLVREGEKTGG